MHLVVEPRGLGDEVLALGDQQVERHGVVVRGDLRQRPHLAPDEQGDRAGVEPVALVERPRPVPARRRPARVDLVHRCAGRDEVLGQPPPVAPRPLDAPVTIRAEGGAPHRPLSPALRAVWPAPTRALAAGPVHRHRQVDPLVCVDPDRDHPAPLPSTMHARLRDGRDSLRSGDRLLSGHVPGARRGGDTSHAGHAATQTAGQPTAPRLSTLSQRVQFRRCRSASRSASLPTMLRCQLMPLTDPPLKPHIPGRM